MQQPTSVIYVVTGRQADWDSPLQWDVAAYYDKNEAKIRCKQCVSSMDQMLEKYNDIQQQYDETFSKVDQCASDYGTDSEEYRNIRKKAAGLFKHICFNKIRSPYDSTICSTFDSVNDFPIDYHIREIPFFN